jgi:hypothetical protein
MPDVLRNNLTYYPTKILKTDKKGNLYYTNGRIHKIDVSDPNNIIDEALTPESDIVNLNDFYVSQNGELYYHAVGHRNRLRNSQGRLFNVADKLENFMDGLDVCRGLNGNLRVSASLYLNDNPAYGIYEIEFLPNGDFQLKEIQKFKEGSGIGGLYIVRLPNKLLSIGSLGEVGIWDSTNPADYAANLIWPHTNIVGNDLWGPYENIFEINDLQYNDSYIYCSGCRNLKYNPSYSLLRIDINTYQCETIIKDNNYEIYSFTVNSDNSVTFTGLRMSDGKNVLVTIDKNGTVINEKVTSTNEKIILERVN